MKNNYLAYILICLGIIWAMTICITVSDKIRAKRGMRRVPEKTLFLFALAGGAVPELVTMLIIRHKTKHKRFMIGLPVIIFAQVILAVAVFYF